MKPGIIGAEKQEVELLFEALAEGSEAVRVTKKGKLEFHEGFLGGHRVVAVCCGIGKVNAALCAQMLISEFGVDAVINTGSAGGLAPGLAVLDMVVSTDAVQHDFDTTPFGYKPGQIPGTDSPFFAAEKSLRLLALAAHARVAAAMPPEAGSKPRMLAGRIASGDAFITDTVRRDRIVALFDPACVEMEGAAIAQVCAANNVPFVILRSVSDLAGKDAGMSYDEFSKRASRMSARVVMEMIAGISGKGSAI